MQIDIGFGDSIYPKAKIIEYPAILNLPAPKIKGYPVESVISEKFEAMVKLGLLNSRMKDFYDIWLMMRQFSFCGLKLTEALKRTFENRKTLLPKKIPLFAEEIYDKKSDRQILWKVFLTKGEIKNAPDNLCVVAKEIEVFLIQLIDSIFKKKEFNKRWGKEAKWKEKGYKGVKQ